MSHKNSKPSSKTRLFRRLCIALDVVVLIALGLFVWYMFDRTPSTNYDVDRLAYPVKGIDVSAHNGDIDFLRTAADSVTFVLLKATEGTDFCDAKFNVNYINAKAAGLKVGAYHFFRFDTPGRIQAEHFLATVNNRTFDLPLAIDVEKWGNVSGYDNKTVIANLREMLHYIKASGYPVMIYTNKNGYNTFIESDFANEHLWICSLSAPPVIDPWKLWQHSHSGRVDGVKSIVDINTFNGSHDDFNNWAQRYEVTLSDSIASAGQ